MNNLRTAFRAIILSPILLPHLIYTTIRDLLFPEIGLYKANLLSFKAFYYHWKDNNPTARGEEFPIEEALLKTLYTRYPSWASQQRKDFIETNHITSIKALIYEIAKNELSPADFEKYRKRYDDTK